MLVFSGIELKFHVKVNLCEYNRTCVYVLVGKKAEGQGQYLLLSPSQFIFEIASLNVPGCH